MKSLMRSNPFCTILFLILLLAFTGMACQLGSVLEATPTPRPVRDDDDDDSDQPPPDEDEQEQEEPTPVAEKSTPIPEKSTPEPDAPVAAAGTTIEQLQAATVQIFAKQTVNGRLQTIWTGSGTILSPDGMILTNAHVAAPSSPGLATLYQDPELLFSDEPEQLVIAMLETADRPPVETYVAELRVADGALDLAVIQIVADIDGNPVDGQQLDLPYVELGDSDTIRLGDEVRVLGYPSAGGETITFSRGNVSGFESQELVGDRAWIKTDATFSPGNSGGLGVNQAGQIIGVPSFVQEAMGGAINRLRSVNYARDLLAAAEAGQAYTSPYVVLGTGNETFTHVTWADDFSESDQCAIGPRDSYPSNSTAAIAIFSYDGMSNGEQVFIAWWLDDDLLATEVQNWGQGPSGDCAAFFVHNFGDPLPEGEYVVELYAGGDLNFVGFAETVIGASVSDGTNTGAATGGIRVEGVITDADSGQPLEGAVIFILNPGTDLEAWLDDPVEADVYAFAETNGEGFYTLPVLLERGVRYPGVAGLTGYRPNEGFLEFTDEDPDVVTIDLELSP